jgi:hypothetical protein
LLGRWGKSTTRCRCFDPFLQSFRSQRTGRVLQSRPQNQKVTMCSISERLLRHASRNSPPPSKLVASCCRVHWARSGKAPISRSILANRGRVRWLFATAASRQFLNAAAANWSLPTFRFPVAAPTTAAVLPDRMRACAASHKSFDRNRWKLSRRSDQTSFVSRSENISQRGVFEFLLGMWLAPATIRLTRFAC